MAEAGACLILRSRAPDIRFRTFREAVAGHGTVLGAARLHEVEALEPGSVPAHTLVLGFDDRETARRAYAELPLDMLAAQPAPLVLLTAAVPPEGLDDPAIPTRANVEPAADDDPVLMLIEGSASDQDRMDIYRGIILPMMFERHGYYTAFELGGDVEVLSGVWNEAIFAISRWPSRDAARDFWLSERYQSEGIPLRLDIGRFEVVLVPACDG